MTVTIDVVPAGPGLAVAVLEQELADLELATRKVRQLFHAELGQAAATGLCEAPLFSVCMALRVHLFADVEQNEGYNSVIRCITERCRHISLPPLAARVNTKKTLGLGSRSSSSKWSFVRPGCAQLLEECLHHHEGVGAVLEDPDRWSSPLPSAGFPSDQQIDKGMQSCSPSLKTFRGRSLGSPLQSYAPSMLQIH